MDHAAGEEISTTTPAAAVETQGLTLDYKTTRAVNGLDLTVAPGELFGLVGPDGAGKTTTLRLLAGLLDITEGSAQVLGFDLKSQAEAIKPHIGYMAQQFSLYAELSVLENLVFFAELFDVPVEARQERIERLLRFAGLTDFQGRRADQLSGGMQKKLALACTLIHEPQLLLLDEPTTGVDPISRREFWNILGELHSQGTTIVVSTPYMDEADRCSQVGLIYAGKLVVCDTPKAIRNRLHEQVIEVQSPQWRQAQGAVAKLPGVSEVQVYGEALHILVDDASKRIPEVEQALSQAGLAYSQVRKAPVRMEEAFISMIKELEG